MSKMNASDCNIDKISDDGVCVYVCVCVCVCVCVRVCVCVYMLPLLSDNIIVIYDTYTGNSTTHAQDTHTYIHTDTGNTDTEDPFPRLQDSTKHTSVTLSQQRTGPLRYRTYDLKYIITKRRTARPSICLSVKSPVYPSCLSILSIHPVYPSCLSILSIHPPLFRCGLWSVVCDKSIFTEWRTNAGHLPARPLPRLRALLAAATAAAGPMGCLRVGPSPNNCPHKPSYRRPYLLEEKRMAQTFGSQLVPRNERSGHRSPA
jgi:hypothetical protein